MIVPTANGLPWAAPLTDRPPLNAFHIAALTFQRARQLKAGARPRIESSDHVPTRLALMEVLSDTVSWTIGPPPGPPIVPTVQG